MGVENRLEILTLGAAATYRGRTVRFGIKHGMAGTFSLPLHGSDFQHTLFSRKGAKIGKDER